VQSPPFQLGQAKQNRILSHFFAETASRNAHTRNNAGIPPRILTKPHRTPAPSFSGRFDVQLLLCPMVERRTADAISAHYGRRAISQPTLLLEEKHIALLHQPFSGKLYVRLLQSPYVGRKLTSYHAPVFSGRLNVLLLQIRTNAERSVRKLVISCAKNNQHVNVQVLMLHGNSWIQGSSTRVH